MLGTHELVHILLSFLAGGLVFLVYRHWQIFLISFLTGVFVDIDHFFDYFIFKKTFAIDLHELSTGNYFDAAGKVFLPLHSFELSLILIFIGIIFLLKKVVSQKATALGAILTVLGLSLSFHLIFDTIQYKPKWQTYFLSYRIIHNFQLISLNFPK